MIKKFQEYDVVICKEGLQGVPAGAKGTILYVFDEKKQVFEIEFVDALGVSLGTFTMKGEDVEAYTST